LLLCDHCGVITVGTEGASKLARHGMELCFGAICGVCACAGCGGDHCGVITVV